MYLLVKIVKMIGELSTTNILDICRHIVNRPFPSSPALPLFQSEATCLIDRKCFLILLQMKLIFTENVWRLASWFGNSKNSTFFQIILRHTWPRDRTNIFGGKSAYFEDGKKGFARF